MKRDALQIDAGTLNRGADTPCSAARVVPSKYSDGVTELCDIAHQRIVEKLVDGDTVCKVTLEDVFDSLIQKRRHVAIELLTRLCCNAFSKDKDQDLERDCSQVLHDFVEADEDMRDCELADMEEEARCEAMENGPIGEYA